MGVSTRYHRPYQRHRLIWFDQCFQALHFWLFLKKFVCVCARARACVRVGLCGSTLYTVSAFDAWFYVSCLNEMSNDFFFFFCWSRWREWHLCLCDWLAKKHISVHRQTIHLHCDFKTQQITTGGRSVVSRWIKCLHDYRLLYPNSEKTGFAGYPYSSTAFIARLHFWQLQPLNHLNHW